MSTVGPSQGGLLGLAALLLLILGLVGMSGQRTSESSSPEAVRHPLDALHEDEYATLRKVLEEAGKLDGATTFALIELLEPSKEQVRGWKEGQATPRRAQATLRKKGRTYTADVDLTEGKLVRWSAEQGEPMVLFGEFLAATEAALTHPDMVAGLERRGLVAKDVFCLPLTAGNFFDGEISGRRLMKAPCFVRPESGSNWYSRPIEGLFATIDLTAGAAVAVTDTGVVAIPEDGWGYTASEMEGRAPLRPRRRSAQLRAADDDGIELRGSRVQWDMWRFHVRTEKRAGLVLSLVEARDKDAWRSVLYQAHLSEVFVPYMDPGPAFYWRTYMDSGEYGFGLFLSPLRPGVDCPSFARYFSARIHDDEGRPLLLPDAVCLFERNVGDAAWRHFEVFAQGEGMTPAEGRPGRELVLRSASQVGNYDYFIDYVFQPDGKIRIMIGSTGIDAVKGVNARNMADPSATQDTRYGTLIAPHLVAPNHDHFFNFRLDFDIDGAANDFMRTALVPGQPKNEEVRRSYWVTRMERPTTEDKASYRISHDRPAMYHIGNRNLTVGVGHHPSYMISPLGGVAYGPLDTATDPPMRRNAYIDKTFWVTPFDAKQRYAGGRFAFQSDGSDTLAEWVKEGRSIENRDLVVWTTLGFHHVPHMEDWPVMSTMWKGMVLAPFNFFDQNPSATLPAAPAVPLPQMPRGSL